MTIPAASTDDNPRTRAAGRTEPASAGDATQSRSALVGAGAAFAAMVSVTIGATFAKLLFPVVGAVGIAGLRIGLGAVMLLVVLRPWRRRVPRSLRLGVVIYGITLGLMNMLIYQAFARIPIGLAVAIEVTGPLGVALVGSRRMSDLGWLALAVIGLTLLVPRIGEAVLDPVGVAFALASGLCWALYILAGKHVAATLGSDAVAWGMLISAVVFVPVALGQAGPALVSPHVLMIGIAIALLSSALPYSLEMKAMQRLPAAAFGLLASASPAVAALSGFVVLGERLTLSQWGAIAFVMAASAGCALTVRPAPAIEDLPVA